MNKNVLSDELVEASIKYGVALARLRRADPARPVDALIDPDPRADKLAEAVCNAILEAQRHG